jgi:penicillin amidase
MGHAIEVARPTLFLLSDDASFITGTTLMVDGGYLSMGPEGLGDTAVIAGSDEAGRRRMRTSIFLATASCPPRPAGPVFLRFAGIGASLVALLIVGALAWGWKRLERSLPQLDGPRGLPGAHASRVDRGSPTTAARACRPSRRARGRTSPVPRAASMLRTASSRWISCAAARPGNSRNSSVPPRSRSIGRPASTRFATSPGAPSATLPNRERTLLTAYAEGVNHALQSAPRPWEYDVLRLDPVAWRPEDTLLCIHAMALDLQDHSGKFERTLITVRETLGADALAFFAPRIGPEDLAAPGWHDGPARAGTVGTLDLNLRSRRSRLDPPRPTLRPATAPRSTPELRLCHRRPPREPPRFEQHGFGVEGAMAGGPALLENDMHLGLSVPTVWYRAALPLD